ncbi:hypothetical protein [Streptomyces sp. NPDC047130]|uniref:hypothetical protein n=1 Tax=Streptomyces sp. NPDC047130 TaxID=3155261 RepID=UPI00340E0A7A
MSKARVESVRRAGRVLVTLHWLKALARPEHRVPEADSFRRIDRADVAVAGLLRAAVPLLVEALGRQDRAEAAARLFRALPDLVPVGTVYGKCLAPEERAGFVAGYAEQHAVWVEEFGQDAVKTAGPA